MTTTRSSRDSLGPDFGRFWLAAAASNLGDGIRLGALPLLALRLTDNSTLIGAVSAATVAPWVIAPLAGVIVDRVDRKRLMTVGQFGRAVLVAVLVGLILADSLSIWVLMAVALGLGCGEVIVDTTSQAAIPQLVEPRQLDRANARVSVATQVLDEVIGVALGAVLFARVASLPFAVDAVTFVLGGVLLTSVRRPLQGPRTATTGVIQSVREGFGFLVGHAFLRTLMFAAAASNLATNMCFGVLAVLVVDELDQPESAYGVVLALAAVGGVLAALVAGRFTQRLGAARVLTLSPCLIVVGLASMTAAHHVAVVGAAWFLIRFGIISLSVPAVSLRQAMTPEHLLGRVVATFRMIGIGASPLGALLGGASTQLFDVRVTYAIATGVMLAAAALAAQAARLLATAPRPPVSAAATEP